MITFDQIKEKIENIKMWQKGDERAPHKPLLLLYALAKCFRDDKRLTSFSEVYEPLKQALMEFGPNRSNYQPNYPFVFLKNDGIWDLANTEDIPDNKIKEGISKSKLIDHDVQGGFTKEIYDYLTSNKDKIREIAMMILDKNFPSSMHEDILQTVGLDLDFSLSIKRKRDSGFREKILEAYEYQCAICGFNVRIGSTLVALEAAHIKWHQAGGPDVEKNGISLCSLHHKLFDRGAFSLDGNMKMIVSNKAHGSAGFKEWLMNFHGKEIIKPQRKTFFPEPAFIDWHIREVFKGRGRDYEF